MQEYNLWILASVSIFDGKWHHIVHVNDTYVDKTVLELREQTLYIDGKLHPPGLSILTALDTFISFMEGKLSILVRGTIVARQKGFSTASLMKSVSITVPSRMMRLSKTLKSGLLWNPCRSCRQFGVR